MPNKTSHILLVIAPMLLFVIAILILWIAGDSFISANDTWIEGWAKFLALLGISFAVFGSFIAALVEIDPQQYSGRKAVGAIFRFWGSMLSFTSLYVLAVVLLT